MFNIFYQAGILAGPLVGLAFMAVDFRLTAAAAAAVFALLTIAQLFALPQHDADPDEDTTSVLQDWRNVLVNRSFLLFAVAMIGSHVLSFQVYLALPYIAAHLAPQHASTLIAVMFAVSGVVAVSAQLRITRWFSPAVGHQPLTGHRHDSGGAILCAADNAAGQQVRASCGHRRTARLHCCAGDRLGGGVPL